MIFKSLYFIVFLTFVSKSYSQSPNLGTVSNFALFTSSGAFENTGATKVIGDIGNNVGTFSGFPEGTVVGSIHCIDAVSAQAANDVDVVYNYVSTLTCGSVLGSTLGNNQILTPNVYCIGEASTLVGNLVFDAQGNADAIFIIQINGALSSAIHSTITLQNDASLQNIYWQINGAVELGDSSVFLGTIVANGAISLLEHSTLYGRGLTRAGAISLHNNVIEGLSPMNALPISLLSFTANQEGENVRLNWLTASETNNDFFSIPRSKDGLSYVDILKIPAKGTCKSEQHYSAVDYNPFIGISYYKLKQTDIDGKSSSSKVVSVEMEDLFNFSISPNPFNKEITIHIQDKLNNSLYSLKLYKSSGEEVFCGNLDNQFTNLDTSLFPSGLYYYTLMKNEKTIHIGKLFSLH